MRKTEENQIKDRLRHLGQIWVRKPSMDYRQASGVEFRGEWVDKKKA